MSFEKAVIAILHGKDRTPFKKNPGRLYRVFREM